MKRYLISDSGNDRIGQTKTFATVLDNVSPVGSLTLTLSTTYSKARDPVAHQVKQTLHFQTADDLSRFAQFLLVQSQSVHVPDTTIGDLLGDPLSAKDVTN